MKKYFFPAIALLMLLLTACQSAYYGAMEEIGVHKREILIDRIEGTQEAQQEAQEQFKDALEEFRSVVSFSGGELQTIYDRFNGEYEASEAAAERIRERISRVENVAGALFDEWQDEIGQYTNAALRRNSQQQFNDTRKQYDRLIVTMKQSEKSMDPVLNAFRDQVLYLKHNLNARAVASLRGEFKNIEVDINQLVAEMQKSIEQSNAFIRNMKKN